MRVLLTLLAAFPCGAAITNIQIQQTSEAALISYNSGTSSACTLVAGLSSSLSPALPQTDTSEFTGGLSDSQFSYLNAGESRVIILGAKDTVRGTASGVPRSIALPAATPIYFQITCGAATSAVLSFVTNGASLGQSYIDPPQSDPTLPGEVLNPWVDMSTRQFYTDPQTGLQLEPLSITHDITQCGAACSSFAEAPSFITANGAWTPTSGAYPYTITNDHASLLSLSARGMHFWIPYPWGSPSNSYASQIPANLNWAQWTFTLSSSGAGDVLVGCMSTNGGASCDPWGTAITCNVPTSSGPCVFGTGATANQGGWIASGYRFRNGPETSPRIGNATCSGTAVTIDQYVNHNWTNGTPITINGTGYTITALTGDYNFTVNSACTSGAYFADSMVWLFHLQASTGNTISVSAITSTWEGGLSAEWPAGGFWGENSLQPVAGVSGNPGYLVNVPLGLGLYWFDAATGAVSLIGEGNLTGGGSTGNLCASNSAAWDTGTAPILYCNLLGGSGIIQMAYSGTFADAGNIDSNTPAQFSGCSLPGCWTVTTITASVDTLAAAFNPVYSTIGTNKGMTANQVVGINKHGEIILRAWASNSPVCGNGCPGWIVVFDPKATTNSRPANAGCPGGSTPGCVVAMAPTFSAGGTNNQSLRGAPIKGSVMNNAGSGIVAIGPYFWTNTNSNGGGPWQIGTTGGFAFSASTGSGSGQITTCPSNSFGVTGTHCTAVPVDGQPYDPTPGPNETGARGEYLTVTNGDYLGVANCVGVGCGDDIGLNGYEMVRVMVANMSSGTCGSLPAPCIWVQRASVRGSLYCGTGGGVSGWPFCGFGALAQSSGANVLLQYPFSQAAVFWDYLNDPMGTSLIQEYQFASGGHQAQQNGIGIDCCSAQVSYNNNGCQDGSGQCYGMKIDPSGNTWNLLSRVTPVFDGTALQNPPFNGLTVPIGGSCSGGGCGNSTQIHPSAPTSTPTAGHIWGQDSRPFNGFWLAAGQPCSATNVTGLLWVIAPGCQAGGGILHRKIFPTHATWGWHPLLDVSPTVIGGTSADTMKYCVAVTAGECRAGSAVGSIYFNVPWLTYPYSYFECQSCASPDVADITIVDGSPQLDSVVEFPLDDPSDRGGRSRVITRGFSPSKVNAPFFETQALPNNQWWIFHAAFFSSVRGDAILVKRPKEIQDSMDRTWYTTPAIPVSGYAGSYTVLEWGYLEYGSDGTTHFNCTTRVQNCRSAASPTATIPFLFSGETQSPTNCAGGCTVTPAFIPDRIALYRVLRTDSSGNVITTGNTQALVVR